MAWTIVYIDDDGRAACYGYLHSRKRADRRAEEMERNLDPARNQAGGGVGECQVVEIGPLSEWWED